MVPKYIAVAAAVSNLFRRAEKSKGEGNEAGLKKVVTTAPVLGSCRVGSGPFRGQMSWKNLVLFSHSA
jgi:phosphoenolpyruvate carboxylase